MLNDDEEDMEKVSKADNNLFSSSEYIFIDSYAN